MNYFLSSIPLWVYIALGLLVAAPIVYYFGPIVGAIWLRLPNWAKWVIGGILGLFGAFAYGRHKGYKDVKAHEAELEKRAVAKREEIHDEVNKLSPTDANKRLDRWMRD